MRTAAQEFAYPMDLPPGQVKNPPSRLRVVRPSGDPSEAAPSASEGTSALQAYLAQLRRHPLMTATDEHAVASELARTGDAWLAHRLVMANLRLVVKLAREYRRAHHNLLDLIQEGNIGLVVAVGKYDPARGVKLASYASWWIRAYILKFILANWRVVKVATTETQRRLFFNLERERAKLERHGGVADRGQLGVILNVSERQIIEMEGRLGADRSLEAPVVGGDKGRRTMGELLPAAEKDSPDAQVESREFLVVLRGKLATFQATLTGRELEIFRRRMLADEPETSAAMARGFGVSRERVRQIEERLRGRMRQFLCQELGDAVGAS